MAAAAPTWPLRLPAPQLRALVARHGLQAAPGSPVAELVTAGEATTEPLPADEAVLLALRVLCAPRQLVWIKPADAPLALLLHTDGVFVRFDAGREGVLLSQPLGPDALATALDGLAGAADGPAGAPLVASRRFLDVLSVLDAGGSWSSEAALRETIRASVAHPERTDAVHAALVADGALEPVADDGVRLAADWRDRHAPLLAPTALRVVAEEREDVALGVHRPRALAVVDAEPRRVVALPAAIADPGFDTLLVFQPLTRDTLRTALASLLEPPAAPPARPVASYEGDPAAWLGGDPSARSAIDGWSPAAPWEPLAARADELPDALCAPGATVELAGAARHVLAFTAEGAIEWTATGSQVRWRTLAGGDPAARIAELLGEAGGAPTVVRAAALSGTVLRGTELVVRAGVPAPPAVLDELRAALAPV